MDSTLDTYSHVAPGLQQAAAKRFDEAFGTKYNEPENEAIEKPVSEMLAKMALPPVMLITWGQIYLKKRACAYSSADRASVFGTEGRGFESL